MTQQLTREQANLARFDEMIAAFNAELDLDLDLDLDVDTARAAQRAFDERFYAPGHRFTVAPVPPLMPRPIEGGYDESLGWADFYAQRFSRRRITAVSTTTVQDRLFVEFVLEADRRDGTALPAHVASTGSASSGPSSPPRGVTSASRTISSGRMGRHCAPKRRAA